MVSSYCVSPIFFPSYPSFFHEHPLAQADFPGDASPPPPPPTRTFSRSCLSSFRFIFEGFVPPFIPSRLRFRLGKEVLYLSFYFLVLIRPNLSLFLTVLLSFLVSSPAPSLPFPSQLLCPRTNSSERWHKMTTSSLSHTTLIWLPPAFSVPQVWGGLTTFKTLV